MSIIECNDREPLKYFCLYVIKILLKSAKDALRNTESKQDEHLTRKEILLKKNHENKAQKESLKHIKEETDGLPLVSAMFDAGDLFVPA